MADGSAAEHGAAPGAHHGPGRAPRLVARADRLATAPDCGLPARRAFFTATGAGALGLYVSSAVGAPQAIAEISAPGVLPGRAIAKYAHPLLCPSDRPKSSTSGGIDQYDLAIRQFSQQILPPGMPATTVWSYGPTSGRAKDFVSPALTIRAKRGRPARIRWRNQLTDASGNYLPHLFAVDPTLHWANPGKEPGAGGIATTDVRPDFTGRRYVPPAQFTDPATQFTDYTGPAPIVPHLHGARGMGDESDGYSEAWFLPDAKNIPAGFARHGRWFEFLAAKAKAAYGATWDDASVQYHCPNTNRASTLWIHDHALGLTRLNVYAGFAGFYLIGDTASSEKPRAVGGALPAIIPADVLPAYELNLAIQDRAFREDGRLFYPEGREYFDPDYHGPWYPEGAGIPPTWIPEFFGNTTVVNGRTWPKHTVERRRYTVRLLNACGSRTLYVDFSSIPGIKVSAVGSEQGYLRAPLDVMAQPGWRKGRLVLAPAERIDLVVDFRNVPAGRHVLKNVGPDGFFGGGVPDVDFPRADPETTGNIMAFDVQWGYPLDITTPPELLALPALPAPKAPARSRRLATTMHFHHLSTATPRWTRRSSRRPR